MSKRTVRVARVSRVIHQELTSIIRNEFKDNRVGLITVSDVEVSPEMSHAKIFITVFEDEKKEVTVEVLNHAAGFFRSQLAQRLLLRSIPQLKFLYDHSIEIGRRMDLLIEKTKNPHDG